MGCCDTPDLMPLDEAVALIHRQLHAVTEQETLALAHSLDRILAGDVLAPIAVPEYDNSAMDGYALRFRDLAIHDKLDIIGRVVAGGTYQGTVRRGQCIRIMTGAPLPDGADTVVMQEDTLCEGPFIKLLHPQKVRPGDHIRRRGADLSRGQIVLTKGKRLGPTDLGLLASLGLNDIHVVRKLRVALMSTGDELKLPGEALAAGQIYDSNRYVLQAMLSRLNVELLDLGIVPDQPSALRDAFNLAAERCDLIISSGGVSVGEADYTREILEELGHIAFWKIALKPGKPLAFGRIGGAWFFGLPGNPVSTTLTFHQIALPALQHLAGERPPTPITFKAICTTDLRKRPGRTEFQRAQLTPGHKGATAEPATEQSSGVLSSYSHSNCYIKLGQFSCDQAAGTEVEVIPFDRWIS